jgi:hypothetical protein
MWIRLAPLKLLTARVGQTGVFFFFVFFFFYQSFLTGVSVLWCCEYFIAVADPYGLAFWSWQSNPPHAHPEEPSGPHGLLDHAENPRRELSQGLNGELAL